MAGPSQNRRIFVVDNERAISETLVAILNRHGFDATAFEDPAAALVAAKLSKPALLISDVEMPWMSGIELAIKFRQYHPDCKVLLFSGDTQTDDLLAELRARGHDFDLLTKPIHPKDLLAKLR